MLTVAARYRRECARSSTLNTNTAVDRVESIAGELRRKAAA